MAANPITLFVLLTLTDIWPRWQKKGFDPTGQNLLLAVSGGADSIALLRFFVDEVRPVHACSIRVAHVHHGLRAKADDDADFVQSLSQQLGLPCRTFHLRPELRPRRESLEAWARRERYAALTQWAAESNSWLLTAHHRDDWIETVFLRLLRGEDWRAYLGMPFRRDPHIYRPFLDIPGQDLRDYLVARGQKWCQDESNDSMRFTRNHLRHRVLPQWEGEASHKGTPLPIAKDFRTRLELLGQQFQEMQGWLESLQPENVQWDDVGQAFLAHEAIESLVVQGEDSWLLRRLRALVQASGGPVALPKKTFLRGFQPTPWGKGGDEEKPQTWSLSRKWQLKREKSFGGEARYVVVALPIPLLFPGETPETTGDRAILGKPTCIAPEMEIILDSLPGEWEVTLAHRQYRLRVTPISPNAVTGFPAAQEGRVLCDAQRFSSTLLLRTRRAGDRFSPLGNRSRTRKLKSFFHEKRVPASERNALPLVFNGDELVWVPGYGLSEWYKVTPQTETLYEMVLECLTMTNPLKTRKAT